MISSGKNQGSNGTPPAPVDAAQEASAASDALHALLKAHPASRAVLRHLAYFAASFRKGGYAVLDSVPLDVLKQALTQLQLAASDKAPSSLQMLALRMEGAVERRERQVRRASRSDNAPSDLMADERMVVSEGRMSDFVRLSEGNGRSGDPAP